MMPHMAVENDGGSDLGANAFDFDIESDGRSAPLPRTNNSSERTPTLPDGHGFVLVDGSLPTEDLPEGFVPL